MKIDEKILHFPPYISTSWNHVRALYVKNGVLSIALTKEETVHIPNLPQETIDRIFAAHSAYLELDQGTKKNSPFLSSSSNESINTLIPSLDFLNPLLEENEEASFRVTLGAFDGLGTVMQHNPAQASSPDLPPEVLQKITAISKIVTPEETAVLPDPEPHCNCVHCQIARAIQQGVHPSDTVIQASVQKQIIENEEEVADSDLAFQQWEIKQAGDKLFQVSNRLDAKESYQVFLGNPIGCTCGQQNCEHIVAVLKS